jgi:hypothetical protein
MIGMTIDFHKLDDPPLWPELEGRKVISEGVTLGNVAVLDKGMQSGWPSVMFRIGLPDGSYVVAEQSGKQIATLGRMIMIKYPHLLD